MDVLTISVVRACFVRSSSPVTIAKDWCLSLRNGGLAVDLISGEKYELDGGFLASRPTVKIGNRVVIHIEVNVSGVSSYSSLPANVSREWNIIDWLSTTSWIVEILSGVVSSS